MNPSPISPAFVNSVRWMDRCWGHSMQRVFKKHTLNSYMNKLTLRKMAVSVSNLLQPATGEIKDCILSYDSKQKQIMGVQLAQGFEQILCAWLLMLWLVSTLQQFMIILF